jgi:hypothetical protein
MIVVDGAEYGTANELAAVLGPDVTPDLVRSWARNADLRRHHVPGRGRGTVYFPLDQAAAIERDKRVSPRGRSRKP